MTKSIILLFGGQNNERHVSTASAQNMANSLNIPLLLWFWAPSGHIYEVEREALLAHQDIFHKELAPKSPPIFETIDLATDTDLAQSALFLLALHGVGVEDGRLQRLLEKKGIAYTGSKSNASALAFDKIRAKTATSQHQVTVTPHIDLSGLTTAVIANQLTQFIKSHKKIVVKPIADGSSFGVHILTSAAQINDLAPKIAKGTPYFSEPYIKGTEVSIGVYQNHLGIHALTCTEICLSTADSHDYDSKYLGIGGKEITPGNIEKELLQKLKSASIRAHQALGCIGYSRSDFIFDKETPVFLETNTLPGLTVASILPKQLSVAGISLGVFLQHQIHLAKKPN